MKRAPVILSGKDLEVEEMIPPVKERTLPHKWLPKEAASLYSDGKGAEMYLFKTAE